MSLAGFHKLDPQVGHQPSGPARVRPDPTSVPCGGVPRYGYYVKPAADWALWDTLCWAFDYVFFQPKAMRPRRKRWWR